MEFLPASFTLTDAVPVLFAAVCLLSAGYRPLSRHFPAALFAFCLTLFSVRPMWCILSFFTVSALCALARAVRRGNRK